MDNTPSNSGYVPIADKFFDLMQFVRLKTAAEMLGCTPDQLLHFGAIGLIEISAPVLAAGNFAWPVEPHSIGFKELEEPVIRHFGTSNRVGIFPYDLAKIEAVGGVVPWRFYAPGYAREAIADAPETIDEIFAKKEAEFPRAKWRAGAKLLDPSIDGRERSLAKLILKIPKRRDEFVQQELTALHRLRENGFYSAWQKVSDVEENAPETTIDHLWISREEIIRFYNGLPQVQIFPESEIIGFSEKPDHGNVEINSKKRFENLFLAIWMHRDKIKSLVGSGTAWAKEVDVVAQTVFPNGKVHGEPSTLEKLLRDALNDEGITRQIPASKKNNGK